ncbi:MAG: (d)CMP kinase [Lachnospiraceae bacterium]|nr:(d)CMP kinase [Lachnospiraceae bacterium]
MYSIAIDGPAGAGKSTIAKLVAKKLQFIYVDTGALYRGLAYACLSEGLGKENREEVVGVCKKSRIEIAFDADGTQIVLLNGENVNPFIRTEQVSAMTSGISVYPEVREVLLELQRGMAASHDVVMDGRDIGTNILPHANVKIFLTASVEERAKRRYLEQAAKNPAVTMEEIRQDIIERDYRDEHRETAPLKKAEDAVLVDSSFLSIEEVAEAILEVAAGRGIL